MSAPYPQIDLGKIRFNYTGDWNAATSYTYNDVVRYGGNLYVLTTLDMPLVSSTPPGTDTAHWTLATPGLTFTGNYDATRAYKVGELAVAGAAAFVANKDLAADTPVSDTASWTRLTAGMRYVGQWAGNSPYLKDDVVKFGASCYIAQAAVTSMSDPATDTTHWQRVAAGMRYQGVWAANTAYLKDDVTTFGASTYIALAEINSATSPADDTANWQRLNAGSRYLGSWAANTVYLKDDIVRYGASAYIALAAVTSATSPSADTAHWQVLVEGLRYQGAWAANTAYKKDDVVSGGAIAYVALKDVNSATHPALDATNWSQLTAGMRYLGTWVSGTSYLPGDTVTYSTTSYTALNAITSTTSPDQDTTNWKASMVGQSGLGTAATLNAGFAPNELAEYDSHGKLALQSVDYTVTALGNVSGTVNIDLSAASEYSATITAATTFNFQNLPTSRSQIVFLRLTNPGAYTITWPSGGIYPGGASALSLTSSGTDIIGVKYDTVASVLIIGMVFKDVK